MESKRIGSVAYAVAVTYAIGNLIIAGNGKDNRLAVDSRIGCIVSLGQKPYRILAFVIEIKGYSVCCLVNLYVCFRLSY